MVRTAGLEPALPGGKQIFIPLRLSPPPPPRRSWSGLSLRLSPFKALGAARLVSTPPPEAMRLERATPRRGRARRGLARDRLGPRPLAFPEFGRFYAPGFPGGTPIEVCCVYRFATSADVARASYIARRRGASRPRRRGTPKLPRGDATRRSRYASKRSRDRAMRNRGATRRAAARRGANRP